MRKTDKCPFCEGDIEGCCFCDHSGKIHIGPGEVFETPEDVKPFKKQFVKESDLRRLFDAGHFNHIKGKNPNIQLN